MPARVLPRTLLCAAALAALTAALALTVTVGGTMADPPHLYGWYVLDAALFALALLLLRRVDARRVAPLVLIGSVLVAGAGLLAPPRTSDDAYRYVWDGRVQASGHSPYDRTPDDPVLRGLRDPELFPTGDACTAWDERRTAVGDCTRINRPAVHTIYPPVAEAWFLAVHPFGGGVRGEQAAGALLAVATTGALLAAAAGERRRRAALWGWCPGVTVWAVNDAHVDTLGALLMVAGLACAARRRPGTGGALLGAAVAVKLLPGLALPGALAGLLARRPGRRELTVAAAALGAFLLAYLPYVAVSGPGVLGYLPGYLREEGYEQGHLERFALLRTVLADRWAPWAAALVLAAVAGWVLRRGHPERPWGGALLVTGTALLLVAPSYPWYGLLVVALVALDGRWEWLAVPAAGQVLYLVGGEDAQRTAYGAALVCVLAVPALRRLARRKLALRGPALVAATPQAEPEMTKP
ncbi:glycosyltransferase 87 family protein [Kitasatospora sp. NPDC101183]|uniref:glycosyltransferase 87 family protein n=1 Tax=Kitasatospora sp. NPDC101183 TaxID=3364100 RepID=UPI0038079A96